MQSQFKTLFFTLIACLFITACGQKGPLFLPGNTNELSATIPNQQQANRAEDEDEEKKPTNTNQ